MSEEGKNRKREGGEKRGKGKKRQKGKREDGTEKLRQKEKERKPGANEDEGKKCLIPLCSEHLLDRSHFEVNIFS